MLNKNQIDVISFDLDDTLWPNDGVIEQANAAMLAHIFDIVPKAKQHPTSNTIEAWYQHYFANYEHLKHDTSARRRAAIRYFLQSFSIEDNQNQLSEAIFQTFYQTRQQVNLYPDSLQALDILSKHFTLVSLTNGNADMTLIEGQQFFSHFFSSEGLQVAKPDPEIYRKMLHQLGADATRVLHVGDSVKMDIHPAKQVGMATAWVDRLDVHATAPCVQADLTVCDLLELARALT